MKKLRITKEDKKSYLMLLLVAMFALVACDNNDNKPQRSEYDMIVDNAVHRILRSKATTEDLYMFLQR